MCSGLGGQEAETDPAQHRDGFGRGDAQSNGAPGQPRVHRGQHEQLRLRGQVSQRGTKALIKERCN